MRRARSPFPLWIALPLMILGAGFSRMLASERALGVRLAARPVTAALQTPALCSTHFVATSTAIR
jgi:hypothetical protein